MTSECIAPANAWLTANSSLTAEASQTLASFSVKLLAELPRTSPWRLGLAGAPGTGKSTLARLLGALRAQTARPCVVLALDDYYLGRLERERLARRQPLMRQRGVPGTHDFGRLLEDMHRLQSGLEGRVRLPRFHKGQDEQDIRGQHLILTGEVPDLIIEGWCVGLPAQNADALQEPVNAWEAEHDAEQQWRTQVNRKLAQYSAALNSRMDRRWAILAPDWNCILEWRWWQEQQRQKRLLESPEAVADFLARFQRLTQHLQSTAADWADLLITLDRQHRPHMESTA